MKNTDDKARLAELNEFIDSYFGGQLDLVVKQLYRTVYMLHYLDRDLFSEDDIIDKVFLLYSMADALSNNEE